MRPAGWDAIVIGAGPAGSTAALLLARGGARVLLVDRMAFPRHKVCGGCLNAHALAALERAGTLGRVVAMGARPIETIALCFQSREAPLAIPPGLAVSRAALDAGLAEAAAGEGATFRDATSALVLEDEAHSADDGWRRVSLKPRLAPESIERARVVLAADGLARSSLRECAGIGSRVARRARVGLGGLVPPGAVATRPGAITMAVGRHGYVGAVDVGDGGVNIAAALDSVALKQAAGPGAAVAAVLAEAGVPVDSRLEAVEWMGTIPLTRRTQRLAARRLFVIGDAAGYVEPFTGEGMAWALQGAEAAVPLARRAIDAWRDDFARVWASEHARRIRRDQFVCRIVAAGLRHPTLVGSAVALLRRRPGLAWPVLAHLRPRPSRS